MPLFHEGLIYQQLNYPTPDLSKPWQDYALTKEPFNPDKVIEWAKQRGFIEEGCIEAADFNTPLDISSYAKRFMAIDAAAFYFIMAMGAYMAVKGHGELIKGLAFSAITPNTVIKAAIAFDHTRKGIRYLQESQATSLQIRKAKQFSLISIGCALIHFPNIPGNGLATDNAFLLSTLLQVPICNSANILKACYGMEQGNLGKIAKHLNTVLIPLALKVTETVKSDNSYKEELKTFAQHMRKYLLSAIKYLNNQQVFNSDNSIYNILY